jgi:GxxExxY protein
LEEYKYKELTGKIIGCAMQVHSFLGNGFPEVVYQRALALELEQAGISFQRELEMDIYYKEHLKPIGTRRVDFLVENAVLVEMKSIGQLEDGHYSQILNYLKAYKIEVGLLINFGDSSLKFKRVVLSIK